jgi:hypothetical protein
MSGAGDSEAESACVPIGSPLGKHYSNLREPGHRRPPRGSAEISAICGRPRCLRIRSLA